MQQPTPATSAGSHKRRGRTGSLRKRQSRTRKSGRNAIGVRRVGPLAPDLGVFRPQAGPPGITARLRLVAHRVGSLAASTETHRPQNLDRQECSVAQRSRGQTLDLEVAGSSPRAVLFLSVPTAPGSAPLRPFPAAGPADRRSGVCLQLPDVLGGASSCPTHARLNVGTVALGGVPAPTSHCRTPQCAQLHCARSQRVRNRSGTAPVVFAALRTRPCEGPHRGAKDRTTVRRGALPCPGTVASVGST